MAIIRHNPAGLFPQYGNYSHAVEVNGDSRILFISGLNGYEQDGATMPDSFEGQAEIIWQHIGTILKSAGMDYTDLISMRFYLASPEYDEPNMRLRKKYLGNHEVSLTVICAQLLETKWKLEIEAVAAK
ncbi:MAG: RidA family protein [Chloroflexota bacterium]